MSEAPETVEGWYVLHDIRKIDWAAWRSMLPEERAGAVEEVTRLLQNYEQLPPEDGSSAAYTIIGHKGDIMLLHLRPTLAELGELERQLDKTTLSSVLIPTYSYVSVTELSRYTDDSRSDEEFMSNPHVQKRLKFHVPDLSHVCFYPMDKKRGEQNNWYTLPMEQRREMMHSHGLIGRKYAGRVVQMISGSMGLDDWEWGVTLFADDPLQFKKIVYEMRFDEVSSKYGVFGSFYVGVRLSSDDLASLMAV